MARFWFTTFATAVVLISPTSFEAKQARVIREIHERNQAGRRDAFGFYRTAK
jgi:hypothetical protein